MQMTDCHESTVNLWLTVRIYVFAIICEFFIVFKNPGGRLLVIAKPKHIFTNVSCMKSVVCIANNHVRGGNESFVPPGDYATRFDNAHIASLIGCILTE